MIQMDQAAVLPITQRDYISYSAITTYQQCPLRYYFRYIAGLPERTVSASLVFGSAIHRAVEHHFNELLAGNEPPCLRALVAEYDRHWQDDDSQTVRFGKDDDIESLAQLAWRMLAAFQKSDLARPEAQIIGVEEQLRGPLIDGCPDLLGRIDLLIESRDALEIIDLKTSRSRWSADQIDDQGGQLLLYSELARQLSPSKAIKLSFAVITKTKEPAVERYTVPYSPRRVNRTRAIVERVWQAIDAGHFYPAPSLTGCPSCSFRDACRAWGG